MSDVMRWRYGETNPIEIAVGITTVIEKGDLLWKDGDEAKPAADLPWQGSANSQRAEFKRRFLGVAMRRSRKGETDLVLCATTGVFEFMNWDTNYSIGGLFGAAPSGSNSLWNQFVDLVDDPVYAIGRTVRSKSRQPGSSVLVDIVSTIMHGGVQCPMTTCRHCGEVIMF